MTAIRFAAIFAVFGFCSTLIPLFVYSAENVCDTASQSGSGTVTNDCVACVQDSNGKKKPVGAWCYVSGGGGATKANCSADLNEDPGTCRVTYCVSGHGCKSVNMNQIPSGDALKPPVSSSDKPTIDTSTSPQPQAALDPRATRLQELSNILESPSSDITTQEYKNLSDEYDKLLSQLAGVEPEDTSAKAQEAKGSILERVFDLSGVQSEAARLTPNDPSSGSGVQDTKQYASTDTFPSPDAETEQKSSSCGTFDIICKAQDALGLRTEPKSEIPLPRSAPNTPERIDMSGIGELVNPDVMKLSDARWLAQQDPNSINKNFLEATKNLSPEAFVDARTYQALSNVADKYYEKYGENLVVTDLGRDPLTNAKLPGSAKNSCHLFGCGVDIGFNSNGISYKDDQYNFIVKNLKEEGFNVASNPFHGTAPHIHAQVNSDEPINWASVATYPAGQQTTAVASNDTGGQPTSPVASGGPTDVPILRYSDTPPVERFDQSSLYQGSPGEIAKSEPVQQVYYEDSQEFRAFQAGQAVADLKVQMKDFGDDIRAGNLTVTGVVQRIDSMQTALREADIITSSLEQRGDLSGEGLADITSARDSLNTMSARLDESRSQLTKLQALPDTMTKPMLSLFMQSPQGQQITEGLTNAQSQVDRWSNALASGPTPTDFSGQFAFGYDASINEPANVASEYTSGYDASTALRPNVIREYSLYDASTLYNPNTYLTYQTYDASVNVPANVATEYAQGYDASTAPVDWSAVYVHGYDASINEPANLASEYQFGYDASAQYDSNTYSAYQTYDASMNEPVQVSSDFGLGGLTADTPQSPQLSSDFGLEGLTADEPQQPQLSSDFGLDGLTYEVPQPPQVSSDFGLDGLAADSPQLPQLSSDFGLEGLTVAESQQPQLSSDFGLEGLTYETPSTPQLSSDFGLGDLTYGWPQPAQLPSDFGITTIDADWPEPAQVPSDFGLGGLAYDWPEPPQLSSDFGLEGLTYDAPEPPQVSSDFGLDGLTYDSPGVPQLSSDFGLEGLTADEPQQPQLSSDFGLDGLMYEVPQPTAEDLFPGGNNPEAWSFVKDADQLYRSQPSSEELFPGGDDRLAWDQIAANDRIYVRPEPDFPEDATEVPTSPDLEFTDAFGHDPSRVPAISLESCSGGICGRGNAGESVEEIQKFLNTRGYALQVDGIYGVRTEAAVRAFQGAEKLRVDGLVGTETVTRMNETAGPAVSNVPPPSPNPAPESQGTPGSVPLPPPRPERPSEEMARIQAMYDPDSGTFKGTPAEEEAALKRYAELLREQNAQYRAEQAKILSSDKSATSEPRSLEFQALTGARELQSRANSLIARKVDKGIPLSETDARLFNDQKMKVYNFAVRYAAQNQSCLTCQMAPSIIGGFSPERIKDVPAVLTQVINYLSKKK